jgi:hypothetical protein
MVPVATALMAHNAMSSIASTHDAAHVIRVRNNTPTMVITPTANTATANTAEKTWTASVFISPFLRHFPLLSGRINR